jgi:hypothetical protein
MEALSQYRTALPLHSLKTLPAQVENDRLRKFTTAAYRAWGSPNENYVDGSGVCLYETSPVKCPLGAPMPETGVARQRTLSILPCCTERQTELDMTQPPLPCPAGPECSTLPQNRYCVYCRYVYLGTSERRTRTTCVGKGGKQCFVSRQVRIIAFNRRCELPSETCSTMRGLLSF